MNEKYSSTPPKEPNETLQRAAGGRVRRLLQKLALAGVDAPMVLQNPRREDSISFANRIKIAQGELSENELTPVRRRYVNIDSGIDVVPLRVLVAYDKDGNKINPF